MRKKTNFGEPSVLENRLLKKIPDLAGNLTVNKRFAAILIKVFRLRIRQSAYNVQFSTSPRDYDLLSYHISMYTL
jgi:hypothetical protein